MSHRYPPGRKARHKAKREARRATALTSFDLSATTTLLYPFQETIPAIARPPRVTPAEPAPWTPGPYGTGPTELGRHFRPIRNGTYYRGAFLTDPPGAPPAEPQRRGRLIAFDDDD